MTSAASQSPAGIEPRRAYFLGTPFSGSTVFGQALGAHDQVTYLGEIDRLVQFPPSIWSEQPDPTCHHCEQLGQECPQWTPERVARARELPYSELMSFCGAEFGGGVLVDGSKHPHWLRATLAAGPVDAERTVGFLTVRSPFAFTDSYRNRTGCPTWQAANMWRDVYYDSLRMLSAARLPFLVVRYEEFALDPEPVLRSACGLLGIRFQSQMPQFQRLASHDIGGNYSVRAAGGTEGKDFSAADFRERMSSAWAKSAEQSQVYWGKPFGGWVDEKWHARMSADDVEQVLQTPGLADLANLLGYQLTREVTAWERREAAKG
jgi:hypothetical protein